METGDLISVIVPVYNVAGYLDGCLGSIVAQTYPHLEILAIGDGSTDGSGAICDSWAQRDPRIRVVHQANGGVSAARNAGLVRATGEFVVFVDSDDTIDAAYAEKLHLSITQMDVPYVVCGYLEKSAEGQRCHIFCCNNHVSR